MKVACLAVVALAIPAGLWQPASAGADQRRHDAAGAWRLADVRWELVKVSAGGRLLVLQARGGPCGRPSFATTAETRSTVELRVQQLVPADLSAIRCRAPVVKTLRVRLSAPIGERFLVDGAHTGCRNRRVATFRSDCRCSVGRTWGVACSRSWCSLRSLSRWGAVGLAWTRSAVSEPAASERSRWPRPIPIRSKCGLGWMRSSACRRAGCGSACRTAGATGPSPITNRA